MPTSSAANGGSIIALPTNGRGSLERPAATRLAACVFRPTHLAALACAFAFVLSHMLSAANHGVAPHQPHASAAGPLISAHTAADGTAPGAFVPNFRLTDHTGTTRELYYESTAKVVVLVFTGRNSPRALQTASALRALRGRFPAQDVVIWQVNPDPGATPRAVAAEQLLFNNDTPVLLDNAQLVTHELGVTRELETFVITAPPFAQIAYRGPLDNAAPGTLDRPTENYAADAIAAILDGRAPTKSHVELPGSAPLLPLPTAPFASYALDVAPIMLRRCIDCHSPGNIAPFAFSNHSDVAARAASIRAALLAKRMSPWHADSDSGVFSNSLALTPAETALLYAWLRAGAPRGVGTDPLTRAAPPSADWPLGPPDLIVSIPAQSVPATGNVPYRYLTVAVPAATERWLRAAVVKPGNSRVVHHALVFEGSLLDVLAAAGGLGGFFAGYVPGMQQTFFPEGTGKRIRPNGQVTFQMHYTTTGQPETDQTQLGLYFASTPPQRELLTRAAATADIAIPPGARDYQRQASFTPSATRDVMLYELAPHMHYRGKRFKYEAMYPDGTSEILLNVPQYDFHWQSQYRLAQPKRLPAGTTIRVSGAFDNSAQNAANPNPSALVRFGEQTDDEMFIGYVNYAELPDVQPGAAPRIPSRIPLRGRAKRTFEADLGSFVVNPPATFSVIGELPSGVELVDSSGRLFGQPQHAYRYIIPVTATNAFGATRTILDFVIDPPTNAPQITAQPQSVRARAGDTVQLSVGVDGVPPYRCEWWFRGAPLRTTRTPELSLTNVTAADAGEYVCHVISSTGFAISAPATVSVDFNGLVNLSARARVGTGADVVIPGITVRGDKPKTLLIRAAGPALAAFGVSAALANPALSVFDSSGQKILVNDNWADVPDAAALRAAAGALGAFALPEGSRDAALLVTVPPGSYTVQVGGVGSGDAAQGVAAVEVYEADASPSTLVNLSCRARVGTGGDILIAGFVLRGTQPRRVLIRAAGPTLGNLGVPDTLVDPKLELYRGDMKLHENDDWGGSAAFVSAFESVGAFALGGASKDAALIVTLEPGAYTAQVSGADGGTGVAIVEVYLLP